jgi:acetyl-CoA C-acetyltransferase
MYIAGGVESMSRAPYVFAKSETPFGRDVKLYDSTIGSRFTNPKFRKLFGDHQMPETGDNVAREFGVTREQADEFALASQKKYAKAEAEGFYKGEIMAIALPQKKKDAPPVTVEADEHPRRDSTLESLAKLKPLYEGGVVTAGNASGVNDGAAALIIASRKWGEKNGKKPIARILSAASAAVEPRIMGVGPAYAIPKALERAGKSLKDMDVIEINEAFASQVLACLRLMEVDFKDPRVNPNGGAIAIGHPLGCSGARLALTVARELQQSGGSYAAVSLCIGVGQGLAVILERVKS